MRKINLRLCVGMTLVALVGARAWGNVGTVLLSDDFESYNVGALDKNASSGPNVAPNGSGNPWWGPHSATDTDLSVVTTQNGVLPHSGTQMIRGTDTGSTNSLGWVNIAYRFNGGAPISGNLQYDWWFYDPNGAVNGANYRENAALAHYPDGPGDTDYPASGTISGGDQTMVERLTLGAANFTSNTAGFPQTYDSTKYQVRLLGSSVGYNNVGWINTSVTRSVGWHHGEISVGPAAGDGSNSVAYYIDNMATSVFTGTTSIDLGYNTLEFTSEGSSVGYLDDVSLTEVPEGGTIWVLGMVGAWMGRRRRGVRTGRS